MLCKICWNISTKKSQFIIYLFIYYIYFLLQYWVEKKETSHIKKKHYIIIYD